MLDRWSHEIIIFVVAGLAAFGLPFAILRAAQPNFSDLGLSMGPDWEGAAAVALIMTFFGIVFYSLPLTLIRSVAAFSKAASTILVGALIQVAGLGILYGLSGGYTWWVGQALILGAIVIACGVGASLLVHRFLNLSLKIEKPEHAD